MNTDIIFNSNLSYLSCSCLVRGIEIVFKTSDMDLDCTPSDIREENEMNIKISIKNGKNKQFMYFLST
jgi:hypothetical protein